MLKNLATTLNEVKATIQGKEDITSDQLRLNFAQIQGKNRGGLAPSSFQQQWIPVMSTLRRQMLLLQGRRIWLECGPRSSKP